MANEKFLNNTGLAYYHDRAKTIFENKIEKVKVNGTEQTITNKEVDLTLATMSAQGSQLNVNGAGMQVHDADDYLKITKNSNGIQLNAFHTDSNGVPTSGITNLTIPDKDYVDNNAGKIDKIKVNGTEQTITNKEVNIDLSRYGRVNDDQALTASGKQHDEYRDYFEIKTVGIGNGYMGISQFCGNIDGSYSPVIAPSKYYVDETFRTEAQVQTAIDNALANITGFDFMIVNDLPDTGQKGIIYLKPNSGNSYDEYIWIQGGPVGEQGTYEKIGTTDVDLSNYYNTTNLVAITTAEIDALFA